MNIYIYLAVNKSLIYIIIVNNSFGKLHVFERYERIKTELCQRL